MLQSKTKCDTMLLVRDGYLICPRCRVNKKVCKITPDTTAHNMPVFCRKCKLEIKIDIDKGQCFESRSQ